MKQQILTFNNFDDVIFQEREFILPDGHKKLQVNYSTISPGTELFCINEAIKSGSSVQPGYILTGTDESGQKYFLFPSLAESSACHCNVRSVGADSLLLPLPPEISLEDAGFLRFINIGMHPFNQLRKLPENVCVIGLGPVGNLAAQTAKLLGCNVTGLDLSAKRRKIANECDITTILPEELERQHNTFDFVIDTVVASSTLRTSAAILRDGGECSMIGIVKDGNLKASELLGKIWQRNLVFRSGWEMLSPLRRGEYQMVSTEENLERALNWIRLGYYKFEALITGIIPADEEQIKKAYAVLKDNPDENMCYLIEWSSS